MVDKIGKFKVGDLVILRSNLIKEKKNSVKGKKPKIEIKYLPPRMVVAEVLRDEKSAKTTFIGAGEKGRKIKDIGSCIKVKCQWFYEGKCQEKIFWEHVLELIEIPTIESESKN